VFAEPGYSYKIGVRLHWTDSNRPDNFGISVHDNICTMDFQQDWRGIVDSKDHLRILYNCPVDRLKTVLNSLPSKPQYTILISDAHAEEYLRWRGGKLADALGIVPPQLQTGLQRYIPSAQTERPRLCSFIIFDDHRVLRQQEAALGKGILLTDPKKVQAIISEYDRLSSKLLHR
jgi:hypothetical protein